LCAHNKNDKRKRSKKRVQVHRFCAKEAIWRSREKTKKNQFSKKPLGAAKIKNGGKPLEKAGGTGKKGESPAEIEHFGEGLKKTDNN